MRRFLLIISALLIKYKREYMLKNFKVIFALTMFSFSAFTNLEEKSYNFTPRGLLIFLDESESALGAVSHGLLAAISQKGSPIIVTKSLFLNILSEFDNQPSGTPEEISEKFGNMISKLVKDPSNPELIKEDKSIYIKVSGFNPQQWIIKKINEDLFLLLPKEYLASLNLSINGVEAFNAGNLSETELQFGLRVNHMPLVSFDKLDIKTPVTTSQTKIPNFVSALHNIFCTKEEYKGQSYKPPLWSIFINGHGDIGYRIAGLSIADFKQFLSFIENKINCRVFIYRSCLSMGVNAELAYKNDKTGLQNIYNFPIIADNLSDTYSRVFTGIGYDSDENRAYIASTNFSDLLIEMTKEHGDPINFTAIATALSGYMPYLENTAQIKLPGLEWFSVINENKDIVSIGHTLTKTRNPNQPLDIVKFFKKDPKVILLYSAFIPFELIINSKNLTAIVPMSLGTSTHVINKIFFPNKDPREVTNLFGKNRYPSNVTKSFIIGGISDGVQALKDINLKTRESGGLDGTATVASLEEYKDFAGFNVKITDPVFQQLPSVITQEQIQRISDTIKNKTIFLTAKNIENHLELLQKELRNSPQDTSLITKYKIIIERELKILKQENFFKANFYQNQYDKVTGS